MRWVWALLTILGLMAGTAAAFAGPGLDPVNALPDAAQEARARALFKELRCVVCQSESLDDSEADLAKDMRSLVRSQIAAGQTDDQVRSYLTSRYGEFVLMKPPARPSTWALWFGPFALLATVIGAVLWFLTHRRGVPEAPLTVEETHQLARDHGNLHKS